MGGALGRILQRRAALRRRFDVAAAFEALEESCVPSYLHPNPLAAGVAWWRLLAACRQYRRHAGPGPLLDFGAGSGELHHLLAPGDPYDFVEQNETLAEALREAAPAARHVALEALEPGRYAAVFALDSLEHKPEFPALVQCLADALAPGGVLVLSGPTENRLYRLGRRIAGYHGHYHHTTIADIEAVVARRLQLLERRRVPLGVPLFHVSELAARGLVSAGRRSPGRHSPFSPAPGRCPGAVSAGRCRCRS